jgi:hypothetical protein
LKQTLLIEYISTIGAIQIVLVLRYQGYRLDIAEMSPDTLGNRFFDNLVDAGQMW